MKKALSTQQFRIMSILWNSGEGMTVSEIIASDNELNINTVYSALKSLVAKNFVEIAGISDTGVTLARMYRPSITKDVYFQDLYSQLEECSTSDNVLAAIIKKENDLNKLNELEQLIIAAKERIRK